MREGGHSGCWRHGDINIAAVLWRRLWNNLVRMCLPQFFCKGPEVAIPARNEHFVLASSSSTNDEFLAQPGFEQYFAAMFIQMGRTSCILLRIRFFSVTVRKQITLAVLQPHLSGATFPGQELQAVEICLGPPQYLYLLDQIGSTRHEHGEITLKLIE